MTAHDPTDLLDEALAGAGEGFVELRYHRKLSRSVSVECGRVDQSKVAEHTGVGVRVHERGAFGFASTDSLELGGIRRALEAARAAARASAAGGAPAPAPQPAELARGRFEEPGYDELHRRPIEEGLELVLRLEAQAREAAEAIRSATCTYNEIFEEKGVVTSDGAKAWSRIARPELRVSAVAERAGEIQRGHESIGVTGAWDCLFRDRSAEEVTDSAARMAVDLLAAGYPEGGRKRVLLSPSLVGLLTHEAIGHTVEADFVQAGSCAQGKLGQRVASELVTLCDAGSSMHLPGAGGSIPVDDEGVRTGRAVVIQDGILVGYLHDRRSAATFGVAPTGNARAWEYDCEPLIRMRNTYIEPGTSGFEEMLEALEDGYVLEGARNGQADSNGEFMFGAFRAWHVRRGKRGPLLRGVNLSGQAFDVLRSVDGVGRDFRWDLGSGHCGKGQPAKVDAGGPWISCEVLLGGRAR